MRNLCLLISFSLLASCNQNKVETTPVDNELKKYFSYKEGSYWVYRDSVSNSIDTLKVVRNSRDTRLNPIGDDYTESITNTFNFGSSTASETIAQTLSWNLIHLSFYLPSTELVASYPVASFPFVAPDKFATRMIPDMIINGNHYSDILEVHASFLDTTYIKYTWDDWIYINRDYGIVKMYLNHSKSSVSKIYSLETSSISRQ